MVLVVDGAVAVDVAGVVVACGAEGVVDGAFDDAGVDVDECDGRELDVGEVEVLFLDGLLVHFAEYAVHDDVVEAT